MIIRGENPREMALLTPAKELYFLKRNDSQDIFIEEERQKAFQRGHKEGEKTGYEKALQETRTWVELLRTLTQKLLEQKIRLLDQLKPEVIEFTINICERVIRKELSQPEAMVTLINSLLNVCAPQFRNESLHIVLAPDDFMMLESRLSQIQYNHREIEGILFRTDPLIKRGDCRIEAQSGLLNHSISRELADLQAKIMQ